MSMIKLILFDAFVPKFFNTFATIKVLILPYKLLYSQMFSVLSSLKTLSKRVAEELFHSKTIIDVFRTLSNIYDKAVSERKNCIIYV